MWNIVVEIEYLAGTKPILTESSLGVFHNVHLLYLKNVLKPTRQFVAK
jgi:hypothetical protein